LTLAHSLYIEARKLLTCVMVADKLSSHYHGQRSKTSCVLLACSSSRVLLRSTWSVLK